MPGSYRDINYSIRPAKSIERKMLCDAFRRVSHIAKVASYRYIGFGSPFFSDFILIHRALGLSKMIDIEKQEHDSPRFYFNRPYKCVKIKFGSSRDVLPRLSWRDRTIAWLDYDGTLDSGVLDDVAFVSQKAKSGSILLISVNASEEGVNELPADERPAARFDSLKLRFGSKLPRTLKNTDGTEREIVATDLGGWGIALLYARMFSTQITDALADRNGTLLPQRRISYRQLFHFHYSDGAKMLTVGGIFFDDSDQMKVQSCGFEEAAYFVGDGQEPYKIEVPSITLKEARYIDRHLPKSRPVTARNIGITDSDAKKYSNLYRWFPAFAETEL